MVKQSTPTPIKSDASMEDLKFTYLQTFDAFALVPGDIVEAFDNSNVNLLFAQEMLNTLVDAGLVSKDDVNGDGEVWQTVPTYDEMDREEAEAKFDEWAADAKFEKAPRVTQAKTFHGCYCGCGENVPSTSFYRPGHDARHAGVVGRKIAANYTVAGYDRREDLAALPSIALTAKAEAIAEKAIERAEGKAKRQAEREAAKSKAASEAKVPSAPATTRETRTIEQGTVKVGKNEYIASRYVETGFVEYFKGDETITASKTAAKTFQVGMKRGMRRAWEHDRARRRRLNATHPPRRVPMPEEQTTLAEIEVHIDPTQPEGYQTMGIYTSWDPNDPQRMCKIDTRVDRYAGKSYAILSIRVDGEWVEALALSPHLFWSDSPAYFRAHQRRARTAMWRLHQRLLDMTKQTPI